MDGGRRQPLSVHQDGKGDGAQREHELRTHGDLLGNRSSRLEWRRALSMNQCVTYCPEQRRAGRGALC